MLIVVPHCSIKEQECEIAQLRAENDMIRKQALPHRLGPKNVPIPLVPAKIGTIRCNSVGGVPTMDGIHAQDESQAAAIGVGANVASTAASPMISSVAKVVQPTATVSSVPVSGPSECLRFCVGSSILRCSNSCAPFISIFISYRYCSFDTNGPKFTAAAAISIDNKFIKCK